jgi:hypothetical protein
MFDKTSTYQDARTALRAFNTVISEHATPDQEFAAERAMLAAGHNAAEGRTAYFGSLESSATPATVKAARTAYDASKADAQAKRDEAAAAAALAAEDADETWGVVGEGTMPTQSEEDDDQE